MPYIRLETSRCEKSIGEMAGNNGPAESAEFRWADFPGHALIKSVSFSVSNGKKWVCQKCRERYESRPTRCLKMTHLFDRDKVMDWLKGRNVKWRESWDDQGLRQCLTSIAGIPDCLVPIVCGYAWDNYALLMAGKLLEIRPQKLGRRLRTAWRCLEYEKRLGQYSRLMRMDECGCTGFEHDVGRGQVLDTITGEQLRLWEELRR